VHLVKRMEDGLLMWRASRFDFMRRARLPCFWFMSLVVDVEVLQVWIDASANCGGGIRSVCVVGDEP